jgi:medium-chain acyl-[acyl-carrier-protein] hydrolase
MRKIKLFCLPYAGGSAAIYNQWKRYCVSWHIDLKPVELRGRGRRMGEPLYVTVNEMIHDVFMQIKNELTDGNYGLFGHSMGAMICYELYTKIKENGYPLPLHIFFSGRGAPHIKQESKSYHLMPDEEFREEVVKLGGTSPEFFSIPELMEVFIPVLKNDFRLVDEAPQYTGACPVDVNISVLTGREDDLLPEQITGWKDITTREYVAHYFDGNHFFLHNAGEEIARLVHKAFERSLKL